MSSPLVIALAKGRLMDRAVEGLSRVGVHIVDLDSRKLKVTDQASRYQFLLVKPADVPIYVEYGAADAGICGRDVLMESEADVLEPLDLGFGYCRLVLAGRTGDLASGSELMSGPLTLRVATKYPRSARKYFQELGIPVEIIRLSGSIELAPGVGLADRIVDLVETGTTLRENGLEIRDIIFESTARLVVNRAAFVTRRAAIRDFIQVLDAAFGLQPSGIPGQPG